MGSGPHWVVSGMVSGQLGSFGSVGWFRVGWVVSDVPPFSIDDGYAGSKFGFRLLIFRKTSGNAK